MPFGGLDFLVLLNLFYSPWKASRIFFLFFLKLKLFSPYKCNPAGYQLDHQVEGDFPFIKKIFNEVLMIAFSKVIYKRLKKSHIFSHVFWYSFNHILRTTLPPLSVFIPHILERVCRILE